MFTVKPEFYQASRFSPELFGILDGITPLLKHPAVSF
jgi:hypothetical protein